MMRIQISRAGKFLQILLLVLVASTGHLSRLFCQEMKGTLKVMTYNIWNGFDWGKDTARNNDFVDWIRAQDPDVLALQELCGYTEEKLLLDAKRWGHSYAVILKTEGYPVGLTSQSPIVVKDRMLDSLWHGMLHVETFGIDFYVVHLSPADCEFRWREASIITDKIKADGRERVMVLGDFNSHSPFDADRLIHNKSLLEKYRNSDEKSKYSNLRDGAHDFSVISTFLSQPLIDMCPYFVEADKRYSFPTPALVGIYQTADQVEVNKERIDYIVVSPALVRHCSGIKIYNEGVPKTLSDHFPVMATFSF
ncbi:MAG: endonuclease/exonuclease/phosphatase family protein [Saprospiraceae bacterium]|nr:endonuclease/exonuclease/phosphatase family protein [Saprospiraceae bacterium]